MARRPRPREILLVEDDVAEAGSTCAMIRALGHSVVVAHDGLEALALLRARTFDLVLMDWNLPSVHGLYATRRIRHGEGGEHHRGVPIIACTSVESSFARNASLRSGMNDHLTKPLTEPLLAEVIRRWTNGEET